MIDVKSIFVGIGGLVIGAIISGLIVWGVERIKVSDALKDAANAKLEKQNVVVLLNDALEREQKYKVTLEDTLIVVQLLKQYQAIDEQTKKDIEEIKKEYVDGKPTKESIAKFKEMLAKINQRNTGIIINEPPFTGGPTEITVIAANTKDFSDALFIEAMAIFFGVE